FSKTTVYGLYVRTICCSRRTLDTAPSVMTGSSLKCSTRCFARKHAGKSTHHKVRNSKKSDVSTCAITEDRKKLKTTARCNWRIDKIARHRDEYLQTRPHLLVQVHVEWGDAPRVHPPNQSKHGPSNGSGSSGVPC